MRSNSATQGDCASYPECRVDSVKQDGGSSDNRLGGPDKMIVAAQMRMYGVWSGRTAKWHDIARRQLVQVIGVPLHHGCALFQVLGLVVDAAHPRGLVAQL